MYSTHCYRNTSLHGYVHLITWFNIPAREGTSYENVPVSSRTIAKRFRRRHRTLRFQFQFNCEMTHMTKHVHHDSEKVKSIPVREKKVRRLLVFLKSIKKEKQHNKLDIKLISACKQFQNVLLQRAVQTKIKIN